MIYLSTFVICLSLFVHLLHRVISNDESDMAMVVAIIKLAHALNLELVAEGVEALKELKILKQHDCKYVQGYYFSKPLNVKDFTKKLEEQNLIPY